jgi:hypothetical protein
MSAAVRTLVGYDKEENNANKDTIVFEDDQDIGTSHDITHQYETNAENDAKDRT